MLVQKTSTRYFAKKEAGGKGFNLYRLTNAGVSVPAWEVLGKRYFERFLESNKLTEKIDDYVAALEAKKMTARECSAAVSSLIVNGNIDHETAGFIRQSYAGLCKEESVQMISVRSSAADEDGGSHSFAGQLSSYLYVSSAEDAIERVKQCWASGFTERGIAYRVQNSLDLKSIRVAVVLQAMIDPEKSGVGFSVDPTVAGSQEMLVSSVYGVGEGIVSGELDGDSYWISKDTLSCRKEHIVTKEHKFIKASSGDCKQELVPVELQSVSSLSSDELAQVASTLKNIEQLYRYPQDVEWAIRNAKLYILQTRPITTIKENQTGYLNLWDNSNIVESYGGLTSPLSFTFALKNYKNVYIQFCEILSVPSKLVKEMESYLGFMLGSFNGRVFYNLYNWYKLVGVLPGFKQNKQFMETMMGVGQELSPEVTKRVSPHPSWDTVWGKFRKFKTGVAFVYYHFFIQSIVDRFLRDFRVEYDKFRKLNYETMSSDEIFAKYLEMDRVMLLRWKAPIINDFLCMVHFGMLKKLTNKWLGRLDTNIQNDLLAGEGNLESAEPTKTMIRMAGEITANPELEKIFASEPAGDLYEVLSQSQHTDFFAQVEGYLDRFGFRCMNEMKLEEFDLSSDPKFLFVCIKNFLKAGITDLEEYEQREKKLRKKAEIAIGKELRGWKSWVYKFSLKHARKAVKNRENTRFSRTRAYGVARSMFRNMGAKFAQMGALDDGEDIFYLELGEIVGVHNGTLTCQNLKALAELRKREYRSYEDLEPKIRFQTRGPVYWRNQYLDVPEVPKMEEGADYDLKGLACCPGVVEGTVKVVHSPADDMSMNGEILVAKRTDPGWVPLFPSASALLVERGSLLSHSAIVAREMGIPAVVGIAGLLTTLKSGMRVRMDGTAGTVKILEQGPND